MVRTVKLSYMTVPQAIEIIAQWRKAQSVVIRTAYNRVREGKKDKEILDLLRTMPQGKLDSWLTLSALNPDFPYSLYKTMLLTYNEAA